VYSRLYARTVGEFRDFVKHGGAVGVNVVWPCEPSVARVAR
jgi:hypothetical protein